MWASEFHYYTVYPKQLRLSRKKCAGRFFKAIGVDLIPLGAPINGLRFQLLRRFQGNGRLHQEDRGVRANLKADKGVSGWLCEVKKGRREDQKAVNCLKG